MTFSLINVFMSPVLGAVSSEPEYLYRCTHCMKMNRTQCEFPWARRIHPPAARIRQLCGAPWLADPSACCACSIGLEALVSVR